MQLLSDAPYRRVMNQYRASCTDSIATERHRSGNSVAGGTYQESRTCRSVPGAKLLIKHVMLQVMPRR